ncbi:hypothetical protein KCU81_g6255, partial [Aureobasidium melanogenum]|uniref:Uncharacterized protein n=1 Tax=Aureobasidium melanogenum (strain CBS 110374) TaxID=1043003 RepID=A0A074W9M6_AURM1
MQVQGIAVVGSLLVHATAWLGDKHWFAVILAKADTSRGSWVPLRMHVGSRLHRQQSSREVRPVAGEALDAGFAKGLSKNRKCGGEVSGVIARKCQCSPSGQGRGKQAFGAQFEPTNSPSLPVRGMIHREQSAGVWTRTGTATRKQDTALGTPSLSQLGRPIPIAMFVGAEYR